MGEQVAAGLLKKKTAQRPYSDQDIYIKFLNSNQGPQRTPGLETDRYFE